MTRPSTSTASPARRWVGVVAALVVIGATWVGVTRDADARPQDRHGPFGAVVEASDGTAELGQFQLGDTVVWCIDLNSYGPQKASGWVTTRTDRIRKQTTFGDRGGHTDVAGDLITRQEIAELAWVLEWAEKHVDDDDSAIAVGVRCVRRTREDVVPFEDVVLGGVGGNVRRWGGREVLVFAQ